MTTWLWLASAVVTTALWLGAAIWFAQQGATGVSIVQFFALFFWLVALAVYWIVLAKDVK